MTPDQNAAPNHAVDPQTGSSRRLFLSSSAFGAVAGGLIGPALSQAFGGAASASPLPTAALKFDDPAWNRDAYARLVGNLDFGKVKHGWFRGVLMGVRPGEIIRPLVGFEGFSSCRLLNNGDGTYQKLLREVGFYTDLKTGEVLEEWLNPYLNERVKVVPIANNPFNYVLSAYEPDLPDYGGLNKVEHKKVPLKYPWSYGPANMLLLETDFHLFYKSALQPDKWRRESSGPMNQVSEMVRYVIRKEDMENPAKTSVEYSGAWNRITPWLPWMLMGQAAGHVNYSAFSSGSDSLDVVSPKVLAYAEKHYPIYLDAPTKWEGKNLSSLETYALTEQPHP